MIKNEKDRQVKVVRAFCIGGESIPVGTVLTLEWPLACEMIVAGKAIDYADEIAEQAEQGDEIAEQAELSDREEKRNKRSERK